MRKILKENAKEFSEFVSGNMNAMKEIVDTGATVAVETVKNNVSCEQPNKDQLEGALLAVIFILLPILGISMYGVYMWVGMLPAVLIAGATLGGLAFVAILCRAFGASE